MSEWIHMKGKSQSWIRQKQAAAKGATITTPKATKKAVTAKWKKGKKAEKTAICNHTKAGRFDWEIVWRGRAVIIIASDEKY